jgi:hypothetical protein
MNYSNNKRMKKKAKAYSKAMRKASVVEGPSNVLEEVKHKGKVLGKYNDLIY